VAHELCHFQQLSGAGGLLRQLVLLLLLLLLLLLVMVMVMVIV